MYGSNETDGPTAAARVFDPLRLANQSPAPPAPEPGSIERHLRALEVTLCGAHGRLDELVKRLTPVLTTPIQTPLGAGTTQPIGSPCAETIRGHIVATEGLVTRINELIDRIDL